MELSLVSQMESGSRLRHRSVKRVQNYRYSTGLMRGAAGRPHGSWRRFINIQSSATRARDGGGICNSILHFYTALRIIDHHRPRTRTRTPVSRRVGSPSLPANRHHTPTSTPTSVCIATNYPD